MSVAKAHFDGNMVGTAVLLMTRFFAKPIVFDIVNKVKRNEVCTAHMGVTRRLPSRFESFIRNAAITGILPARFQKFAQGHVLFRRTDDATLHDTIVNHN